MQLELVRNLSVSEMFEEPFVFIFSDIAFVPVPDGLQVVDELPIELDRVSDKQRVLAQYLLNLSLPRELTRLCLQLQCDSCASLKVKILDSGYFVFP